MFKKLSTLLFLNIVLFQSSSYGRDKVENHLYELLAKGNFETTVSQSIPIYYQGNIHSSIESAEAISETVEKMLAIANYDNIEVCQDISIKIFVIDHGLLHDRSIMNFLTWKSMPKNIWGAYDSFHDQGTGELYINGIATQSFTKRIFAHEFWHHVQDITCQERSESGAEDFANTFCTATDEC